MKWNNNLNRKYTQISLYVIVTAVIIYILSLLAKNAPTITKEILEKLGSFVKVTKPIIIGFIIAYLFDPVVCKLEEWYTNILYGKQKENTEAKTRKIFGIVRVNKVVSPEKKLRRARLFAVLTTVLLIMIVFVIILSLLVYSVTDQLKLADFNSLILLGNEYVDNVNEFIKNISSSLENLKIEAEVQSLFAELVDKVLGLVRNFATSTVNSIGNISSSFASIAFSIIIGIWFMIDGGTITKYIDKVFYALFSSKTNRRLRYFGNKADTVFSGYIRGQLLDAFVMMILISLTLSIIGVKFAIVIGIIAGFGNLIPYLGPVIAYAGCGLVCVVNGQYKTLFIAIIALIIIQAIDGNLIGPKLLSKSIQVHPLLVIISLIFGSAIGGLLGMLLAVPIGALLNVLFVEFIEREYNKKLGNDIEKDQ